MFKYLSGVLGLDVGIDLGSANVVVYVKDKGIVLSEPSAVAVRKLPRGAGIEVIAVDIRQTVHVPIVVTHVHVGIYYTFVEIDIEAKFTAW